VTTTLTLPNCGPLLALLGFIKSLQLGRVHVCDFTNFKPMKQKVVKVKMIFVIGNQFES
jgi:hypothetical protein